MATNSAVITFTKREESSVEGMCSYKNISEKEIVTTDGKWRLFIICKDSKSGTMEYGFINNKTREFTYLLKLGKNYYWGDHDSKLTIMNSNLRHGRPIYKDMLQRSLELQRCTL